MKMVKVYITVQEMSDYIQNKIPEKDRDFAEDCTWVPVRLELLEDMTVMATIVAAKNGNTDPRRYHV